MRRLPRWLVAMLALGVGCSIGKIGNGLDDTGPDVVAGRVVDIESGSALAGVRIQAGDLETTSDFDGTWRLPVAAASRSLVLFRRGYAPQVEPVTPGRSRYLTVGLQPALLTRTLAIAEGGDIALDADRDGFVDLTLHFPPGFLDEEAISGPTIGLTISMVEAESDSIRARFPGSFLMRDATATRLFATYGAFNVTFHDGDRLLDSVELARAAEARMAVDGELREGEQLALSWLDPDTGTWQQDDSAIVVVKNGIRTADATVGHFTWWTLAEPIEQTGCVTVRLQPDAPVAGAWLSNFELYAAGVDYVGVSPPVPFSPQGTATVRAWAGRRVRLSYGYNGARSGSFAVDVTTLTVPASGCAEVDVAFPWRTARMEGFVLNGGGAPVTDTLVVIEEAGRVVRPRQDGYWRVDDLPWAPSGTTVHVRALPTPTARFVAQEIELRQPSARVDLEPAKTPLAPVFLEAVLDDAEPVTTTGTRFRFIVADEQNGLSWNAVPTVGEIRVDRAESSDDGSTYTLTVEGAWSANVTGPAELYLRVTDSDGRQAEQRLSAHWR